MRVPLLSGTRLLVVNAPDDAIVLAPPAPPPQAITDVGAAVRDALRFPLAGPPLHALVPRGARAAIVTNVPALPMPSAPVDARRAAVGAAVQELRNLGVPDEQQTILVTAGLARRPGRRELDHMFAPAFARAFHGRVRVHDVEDPDLVDLGEHDGIRLRVAPAIADADVVVVVSAAETVLHGGPATLLAAAGPDALRAAGDSLTARGTRLVRLEPRARSGARARSAGRADGRLAHSRPPADLRHCIRLPLRPGVGRAHRTVEGRPPLSAPARDRSACASFARCRRP